MRDGGYARRAPHGACNAGQGRSTLGCMARVSVAWHRSYLPARTCARKEDSAASPGASAASTAVSERHYSMQAARSWQSAVLSWRTGGAGPARCRQAEGPCGLTFEFTCGRQTAKPADARQVERRVRPSAPARGTVVPRGVHAAAELVRGVSVDVRPSGPLWRSRHGLKDTNPYSARRTKKTAGWALGSAAISAPSEYGLGRAARSWQGSVLS